MSFDGFKAVDDLTFYVDENEIRVIIGPNGAGKTTVLDLICGKTKRPSGSIKFKGKELTRLTEHEIVQPGVGRKFQTPSIYEDLTVFENLEISYPARPLGVRRADLHARRRRARPGAGGRRDDLPEGPAQRRTPSCSATARSSGSRSACC